MTTGWVKVFDQSKTRVPMSRHKEMYDDGFRVMAGYAGGGSSLKWTPVTEIHSWLAQGPDTGFAALFEIFGTEPIDSPSSGLVHAQTARAAWRGRGYPDYCSIAAAVDENVTVPEARVQLTQYFTLWNTWDTAPPLPYVEMDAGAILFAEGITAGTFTPAAYSWDPSDTLITPENAPMHVVWTQEKNGQNLAGGNVDIGHIRTTAKIQWADKRGENTMNEQSIATAVLASEIHNDVTNTDVPWETFVRGANNQLNNLLTKALPAISTKIDALQTAVSAIPTTAIPTAPLSDEDVQRIATALANQLRGTL